MQHDHAICSQFSNACVFLDCSSTENVPKTVYIPKIVGYR